MMAPNTVVIKTMSSDSSESSWNVSNLLLGAYYKLNVAMYHQGSYTIFANHNNEVIMTVGGVSDLYAYGSQIIFQAKSTSLTFTSTGAGVLTAVSSSMSLECLGNYDEVGNF